MGKGTIVSGGSAGEYQVQLNFNTGPYDDQVAALTAAIAQVDTAIEAKEYQILVEFDPAKLTKLNRDLDVLLVQKLSFEKRKTYLEDGKTADPTISAWCGDLTEDLTGVVGTIEIPGESEKFNIQPGYDGNAAYDSARDGQLMQTIMQTPAQAFYNLAMLPGWQKWRPLYRYATLSNLNEDTGTITLEAETSTQQALNVNQGTVIPGVSIEYMTCDGQAFEDGDSVLVKFTGQDYSTPVIVGFKDNPQPCGGAYLLIKSYGKVGSYGRTPTYCTVFDLEADAIAVGVKDNNGDPVTFPCLYSTITDWVSGFAGYANPAISGGGSIAIPAPLATITRNSPGVTITRVTVPCPSPSELLDCHTDTWSGGTYEATPHPGITYYCEGVAKEVESDGPYYDENDAETTADIDPEWVEMASLTNVVDVRYRTLLQSATRRDFYHRYHDTGGDAAFETELDYAQDAVLVDPYWGEIDVSYIFAYELSAEYLGQCFSESLNENINDSYFWVQGIAGAVAAPYLLVFTRVEIQKESTVLNFVRGTVGDFVCTPPKTAVVTTSYIKEYATKTFLATSAGDPMDLNPFDAPEHAGAGAAIDGIEAYITTAHTVTGGKRGVWHTFSFLA